MSFTTISGGKRFDEGFENDYTNEHKHDVKSPRKETNVVLRSSVKKQPMPPKAHKGKTHVCAPQLQIPQLRIKK